MTENTPSFEADLGLRIVPADPYEKLWHKRCRAMHRQLDERRGGLE